MTSLHIPLKRVVDESYSIAIGHDLLPALIADLQAGLFAGASRIALISDSQVFALYGQGFLQAFETAGLKLEPFIFPAGELHKTRQTKADIEDAMLAAGFNRDSAVICLGGGVVSDLGGFLAGTFGRGIPFVNYSTTLLSAADASVGGKTAVDTPHATNLIGLFNQPRKVYIDIATWRSLPDREIRSGLAETIKHACLADASFFDWLERNIHRLATPDSCPLDKEACEYIALMNCRIKQAVVSADEREANLRQVLNLGHTAGRALETLAGYTLLHGECVAIGIAYQCHLGVHLGLLSAAAAQRCITLLRRAGLPVAPPAGLSHQDLVAKMHTDKKSRGGRIRFVFMKGIGAMHSFENGSASLPVAENALLAACQSWH